ncbi:MAG: isopenicillin N synthase family oxygenase, partial [Alphaproteobacteria bacterium]|nr:isopenicillin N synthase family oxygenase [Alphaproteobacteria bacterium]
GPYLAGAPGAREALAGELREACESVGFYYLVNHGVPQSLIDMAFEEARRFHALPDATKMRVRQGEHYVGYVPPGGVRINAGGGFDHAANKVDLHEAYHINLDFPVDHPGVRPGRRFHVPQPWPDGLAGFRENIMTYHRATFDLGQKLLAVYATALGAAPDHFAASFVDPLAWLRLIHYPKVERREKNQFGVGAHSDGGFLTLLPQTEVPGLEICMPDGTWSAPPPLPGAYIVNARQILRRWSNDRFVATLHRVISPLGNVDRYSVPMFFNPAADARIECLLREPGEAARYPSTTYGDHLNWYLAQTYKAAANSRVDAA